MNKINDEALKNVTGGYNETSGYAQGFMIRCPRCGASNISDFESSPVDSLGQQYYRCHCGQAFLLDGGGYGTLLNYSNNSFSADRVPTLR